MGRIGYIATQCHWCGRAVQFSRAYYPRKDEEVGFLHCDCGAVGLASCNSQADWPRVVAEVLGQSAEQWPNPAWAFSQVEQWEDNSGYKFPSGREIAEGVDEQRYLILWGRRKGH